MNDHTDKQLADLFAAARAAKPDTSRIEYGFETRLLARIRETRRAMPWFAWAWKLCPAFASLVIALGMWAFAPVSSTEAKIDLRAAAIAGSNDELALVEYFSDTEI
jgi:hypothetical protein